MTEYRYQAFHFHQRTDDQGPAFCLFAAPVGEISAWADVERLQPDAPRAVQREPVLSRINSIKRFFDREPANTIPTAIVIAVRGAVLTDREGCTEREILITTAEGQQKPGLIIDGQHRLRGMERYQPEMRVPVVAILDPDDLEMAFQFLVINNKAARVPRDHLRALALNYDQEALGVRLQTARLSLDENLGSVGAMDTDEESPFQGMIAWPNNPRDHWVIVPATIEAIAGYARSLGFRELDDADALNAFLFAIWWAVRDEWAHVFNPNTHLLEKVGIICLTQYVGDTINKWRLNPRSRIDVGNPEEVKATTVDILDGLDPDFFKADWASTSYDTRAGRDQIMAALTTIASNRLNGDPWYVDVDVISRDWLDTYLQASLPEPGAVGDAEGPLDPQT